LFRVAVAEGRAHYDRAVALYDPSVHRPLATRFGQDVRVVILSQRSIALWSLGYPEAGLADIEHARRDAREIGQAATLAYALMCAQIAQINCGDYSTGATLFLPWRHRIAEFRIGRMALTHA
jgi:hypothetical protein